MHVLAANSFLQARLPQKLKPDEIHLWLFTQCSIAATRRSAQENRVRVLLAAYLAIDADSLRFDRDAHGKPYLADLPSGSGLQFNLSHTTDYLLIGISRDQALGVDLETVRGQRPWLELARRYFSAAEFSALAALSADRHASAFLEIWSCKEAVLKALGHGIAFGLHRLEFAVDTDGSVEALVRIDEEAGALAQWQVVRLALAPGVLGAVAWNGPTHKLRAFRGDDASREFLTSKAVGSALATFPVADSS